MYSKYFNHPINPLTDICVTGGAVSALDAVFRSLIDPNDEVILFDPSYDCYRG